MLSQLQDAKIMYNVQCSSTINVQRQNHRDTMRNLHTCICVVCLKGNSHCIGTGPRHVHGHEPVLMASNIHVLYINIHTGPRQGPFY